MRCGSILKHASVATTSSHETGKPPVPDFARSAAPALSRAFLLGLSPHSLRPMPAPVRRRHAEGGRERRERQICVPVHHSGRRHDRLRDPGRVQREDGGADCRHLLQSRMIKSRHFHRAVNPSLTMPTFTLRQEPQRQPQKSR